MPFVDVPLGSIALLFVAALVGGALNAVAGGGSFLVFPALVVTGVPPINANATNTIALWPGVVASVGAYRRELAQQRRSFVMVMGGISLIGGLIGAVLLLKTPQSTFAGLVPFLLLMATVLFAFGPRLVKALRDRGLIGGKPSSVRLAGIMFFQLLVAIYGGYFGGGIGILMLAALELIGMDDFHQANALRTLLSVTINSVAVVTFVLAGIVVWSDAILMAVAAMFGGYGAAAYARRLPPGRVRTFVVVIAVSMTAYFFVRSYVLPS
jgi:uncharacterized protein